jgi:hypothetical protein
MRMNPEISQSARDFLRGLEELTARTGIKVASLDPDLSPVLELQGDNIIVAQSDLPPRDRGVHGRRADRVLAPDRRAGLIGREDGAHPCPGVCRLLNRAQ